MLVLEKLKYFQAGLMSDLRKFSNSYVGDDIEILSLIDIRCTLGHGFAKILTPSNTSKYLRDTIDCQ